jgi:uncharacterized protein YydD (DUF2326 family)
MYSKLYKVRTTLLELSKKLDAIAKQRIESQRLKQRVVLSENKIVVIKDSEGNLFLVTVTVEPWKKAQGREDCL